MAWCTIILYYTAKYAHVLYIACYRIACTHLSHSAAVDASMVQNAVLELKIAGIKHLQHAQFVRLLGDSPSSKEER